MAATMQPEQQVSVGEQGEQVDDWESAWSRTHHATGGAIRNLSLRSPDAPTANGLKHSSPSASAQASAGLAPGRHLGPGDPARPNEATARASQAQQRQQGQQQRQGPQEEQWQHLKQKGRGRFSFGSTGSHCSMYSDSVLRQRESPHHEDDDWQREAALHSRRTHAPASSARPTASRHHTPHNGGISALSPSSASSTPGGGPRCPRDEHSRGGVASNGQGGLEWGGGCWGGPRDGDETPGAGDGGGGRSVSEMFRRLELGQEMQADLADYGGELARLAGREDKAIWTEDDLLAVPYRGLHVLEAYGLSSSVRTQDLESHLRQHSLDVAALASPSPLHGPQDDDLSRASAGRDVLGRRSSALALPADVRWIDDEHALLVFPTPSAADNFLAWHQAQAETMFSVRHLNLLSPAFAALQRRDFDLPRARPKTSAQAAQRMIASASDRATAQAIRAAAAAASGYPGAAAQRTAQEAERRRRQEERRRLRAEAWGEED